MYNKNQRVSVLFMLFCMISTVCLIAANVFETKQLAFFGHSQTGGVIVFPISYIMNDVVCEVWGFRKARLLIWLSFLFNFFFVGIGALCDYLPGADYWTNDEGFHAIFGLAPRIAACSFLAFLVGSFTNAYVMSRMKIRQQGRHFSVRAIVSTLWGEGADSVIFFPLAFGGLMPVNDLLKLMLFQVFTKTAYEVVMLPFTTRVVRMVKRLDDTDVYDNGLSYNPLKVNEV